MIDLTGVKRYSNEHNARQKLDSVAQSLYTKINGIVIVQDGKFYPMVLNWSNRNLFGWDFKKNGVGVLNLS